jgi:nicotinamide-nucleotide amidase
MFSKYIKDLATETLDLCRKNKLKIATAESLTGGLIIGALTEIPGSSDVVELGFITYTSLAKQKSLNVSPATLNSFGEVSEQTAKEMVFGALVESEASIAISITGIAGPHGGEKESIGLVHMAAQKLGNDPLHEKHQFGNIGRAEVREASIIAALNLLKKVV